MWIVEVLSSIHFILSFDPIFYARYRYIEVTVCCSCSGWLLTSFGGRWSYTIIIHFLLNLVIREMFCAGVFANVSDCLFAIRLECNCIVVDAHCC